MKSNRFFLILLLISLIQCFSILEYKGDRGTAIPGVLLPRWTVNFTSEEAQNETTKLEMYKNWTETVAQNLRAEGVLSAEQVRTEIACYPGPSPYNDSNIIDCADLPNLNSTVQEAVEYVDNLEEHQKNINAEYAHVLGGLVAQYNRLRSFKELLPSANGQLAENADSAIAKAASLIDRLPSDVLSKVSVPPYQFLPQNSSRVPPPSPPPLPPGNNSFFFTNIITPPPLPMINSTATTSFCENLNLTSLLQRVNSSTLDSLPLPKALTQAISALKNGSSVAEVWQTLKTQYPQISSAFNVPDNATESDFCEAVIEKIKTDDNSDGRGFMSIVSSFLGTLSNRASNFKENVGNTTGSQFYEMFSKFLG